MFLEWQFIVIVYHHVMQVRVSLLIAELTWSAHVN